MTVQEVAEFFKVAPITVRRYIADGRLPAVRVGRGVRVSKEAVERLPEAIEPEAKGPRREPHRRKALSLGDPLWSLVGIGASDELTDIREDKRKYLAEAYEAKGP